MSGVPQAAGPRSVCVLDLGVVLLDRQPAALAERLFPPAERGAVVQQVLMHSDWLRLDRGTLSLDAAIDAASGRTGLPRRRIATLFHEMLAALVPKPSTVAILERVCARGHAAYCLSNMPRHALGDIMGYRFWRLFNGAVISSRCGMVKHESRIYRWLLQTHAVDPAQAFFIDDRLENITAANAVGIAGHCFQGSERCETALAEVGLL